MTSEKENGSAYEKWKSTAALIFEGKTAKERLLTVFYCGFFIFLAFTLSATSPFISEKVLGLPIADALLCGCGAYTPFTYLGAMLGTFYFGYASPERFLLLTFTFVLRIVTGAKSCSRTGQPFGEGVLTKTSVAAVMAFIETGTFLAKNGINSQSAITAVATLSVLPALTIIFAVYYFKPSSGKLSRGAYELSLTAVLCLTVSCSRSLPLTVVSPEITFTVIFVLAVAKYGGAARAGALGFLLGYIAAPAYFIAFTVLGAMASLTFSFGILSAVGVSAATACVVSILSVGHTAIYYFIPDLMISVAIASPFIKYSLFPKEFPYPHSTPGEISFPNEAERIAYASLSTVGALRRSSDGLRAIDDEIRDITPITHDASHPKTEISEKIRHGFCEKCPMSPICLETERAKTELALNDLVADVTTGSYTQSDAIPLYLSEHCIRLKELTEHVVKVCQNQLSIAPVIPETKTSTLISYSSCADLLSSVAEASERELVFDKDAEKNVRSALHKTGISFSAVSVIGVTRKTVYLYGAKPSAVKSAKKEILAELTRIFGIKMELKEHSDASTTVFSPAKRLTTETFVALSAKEGEAVCGDSALTFNDGRNFFYALLSDGMGSGDAALRSSTLVTSLIKNLLIGGIEQRLAVRLSSEALSRDGAECFSTVDLLRLDLVSGKATVTKSFACPTYVLHSGSVYRCDAQSMPIGITKQVSPYETDFVLSDGDTVIMLSDGISDCPENELRISDVIGLGTHLSAKDLAERILERAIEINGKSDDMSALVVKILKAS